MSGKQVGRKWRYEPEPSSAWNSTAGTDSKSAEGFGNWAGNAAGVSTWCRCRGGNEVQASSVQAEGQRMTFPGTGRIGLRAQASRNCSRNCGPRSCGMVTKTTQNRGKFCKALAADSLNSRSRVNTQENPAPAAASTSSPLVRPFQPRDSAVCAVMPRSARTAMAFFGMLTSSSHMRGV